MAGESAASAGDSFIGSFISLISKYEIRYEGILYHINVQDSTIGLKNVRSYGTEGRKKDGQQVPPSDKVYEYILFRGSDIKDLQVKSSPPAQKEEQINNDPAIIIQSQYVGVPSSSTPLASVGKNSLTESTQWQDTPALTSKGYPGTLPSNQSATQQSEHSPAAQTTIYQQGYNGASIGTSNLPQQRVNVQPSSVMANPAMQPYKQAPEIQASMTLGSANASEFRTPVSSSSAYSTVNPRFSPSLSPVQYSTSPDALSLSTQASLPSHSTSLTASTLTMSSFPSSRQDLNINETQIVHKAVSDSIPVLPVQSVPYPTPFMGSNLSPLLTPPQYLLTPDQSAHSGSYVLSSTQKLYPNQKDRGTLVPMPSNSSSSIPPPGTQAPLLPLPTSTQKAVQFTEEFDFTAMNEKFKKDDLWGYLGKSKQMDKAEGAQDNVAGHRVEEKEGHGSVSNQKLAYNKDDFFDSISCTSQTRGARNGQNRYSERFKLDTETFGFQQRPNPGYGGYGAGGRGENFRGSHNWGRGYGYGGRGRGGNMPF